MNVREKLVELIGSTEYGNGSLVGKNFQKGFIEKIASNLIAHGITVQECKVGDTIYEVDSEHGVIKHDVYEVCVVFKTTATDDKGNEWDDYWTLEDIANAFSLRNEAELKLLEVLQKG